jgi:NADPH2:quinone reductase
MQAIRVHHHGGPEVLECEDVPDPRPGRGEALVAIEAAGVNFIDVYFRTGAYPAATPFTPGMEAAGRVLEVGPEVREVRAGDRVAYAGVLGAYAQRAVVPAERLVPLPVATSTRDAAAAMLQGMTAHYLATSTHPLEPGDTCLVHAAAGGVGLLLCQIAKRRGARVLATVSSDAKARLAREAGADETILYTREDFAQAVARLTGGAGVQVVYDSVGRTTFEKGLGCLARRGTMALFGQSSGAVAPFDPQVLNLKGSLYLTRPSLNHYTATRAELLERAGEVLAWIADGRLRLRIDRELPLERAADVHRALEGRETSGKLLLIP